MKRTDRLELKIIKSKKEKCKEKKQKNNFNFLLKKKNPKKFSKGIES